MALEQEIHNLTQAIVELRNEMVLLTTTIANRLGAQPQLVPPTPVTSGTTLSPVQALQPQLEQAIVDAANVAQPNPTPAGELDSAGQPWDARIHASTKTKVSDGTWKLKRGVPAELIDQVRAGNVGASAPAQVPANLQTPAVVTPAAGPTTVPAATGPSYDEVKARAAACSRVLGVNAGKIPALLSRFGVDRLSALDPQHYGNFVEGLSRLEQGGDP